MPEKNVPLFTSDGRQVIFDKLRWKMNIAMCEDGFINLSDSEFITDAQALDLVNEDSLILNEAVEAYLSNTLGSVGQTGNGTLPMGKTIASKGAEILFQLREFRKKTGRPEPKS